MKQAISFIWESPFQSWVDDYHPYVSPDDRIISQLIEKIFEINIEEVLVGFGIIDNGPKTLRLTKDGVVGKLRVSQPKNIKVTISLNKPGEVLWCSDICVESIMKCQDPRSVIEPIKPPGKNYELRRGIHLGILRKNAFNEQSFHNQKRIGPEMNDQETIALVQLTEHYKKWSDTDRIEPPTPGPSIILSFWFLDCLGAEAIIAGARGLLQNSLPRANSTQLFSMMAIQNITMEQLLKNAFKKRSQRPWLHDRNRHQ